MGHVAGQPATPEVDLGVHDAHQDPRVSVSAHDAEPCYMATMAYWLLKSEPDDWSWSQQVAKGRAGAEWTGIRNFSARNHMRAMKKGEEAFFYHTGKERTIVGIVKVIAEAHPDSTDKAWDAIDVAAVRALPEPVSLDQIKKDRRLASMTLVRISRLSVQPVSEAEWRIICQLGGLRQGS